MAFSHKVFVALIVGGALAASAGSATATTVSLPTSGGSLSLSYQDLGPGSAFSGGGTISAFTSASGSAFYGDSFTRATTPITDAPTWGFYDDFEFSVPTGVTADTITDYINLGNFQSISNLEVRLYSAVANPTPVLGNPVGGVVPGASWSSPISAGSGNSGMFEILNTTLSSGTYFLEVRGNVDGTGGGAYSGTLNIAPVPLPAALPLLLSGFGLLGGLFRKRRAS
jgi:hypothetical protein